MNNSFAFRISVAGLVLSAAFLLVLGGVTYTALRTEIQSGLTELLDREALTVADEVAGGLRITARKLEDIAENPIIANALTDTVDHARYVTEFFSGFATIGAFPLTIGLTDFTGRFTVSNGVHDSFDGMQPAIKDAIEGGRSVAFVGQVRQQPVLILIEPVFIARTGSIEGAVVALIRFSDLLPHNWMARPSLFTARVGQTDTGGGWHPLGPSFGAAEDEASSARKQRISAVYDLSLGEPLNALRLTVNIRADETDFYAPLDRVTGLFAKVGALIAVTVIVICLWGGRRLCAPLRELEAAAQSVVDTQSFDKRVSIKASGEVERLGEAFNRMFERLALDNERRRAFEAALRESEARIRALIDHAPAGVFLQNLEGRYIIVNEEFGRIASAATTGMIGKTPDEVLAPNLSARSNKAMHLTLTTGRRQVYEMQISDQEGGARQLLVTRFPILDDNNAIIGVGGIVTDISEYKKLQDDLAQAQKAEAIGQLTGGIAHDFNNLLTVILGNSGSLAERLDGEPELVELAEQCVMAAERAADLTQQLLAYARQQRLRPRTFDPNILIADLQNLLHRTLEETVSIDTRLAHDLWTVKADPTGLETSLLNLALNARDAMPDGGRLTIATENCVLDKTDVRHWQGVVAGEYVRISVEDTGCGMSPAVAESAFDPFFTTKEVGKGTGLGLSMVHGFAKQSGGQVSIDSEVDQGTIVTLYLPRSASVDREAVGLELEDEDMMTGAGEHILVVEDDDLVRDHVTAQLERLGYCVTAAQDGEEALKVVDSGVPLDLVFSDIVMPGGLGGVELATILREQRAGLPVLLTTGYDRGRLSVDGEPGPNIAVLQKPYPLRLLACSIREALAKSDETIVNPSLV